MNGFLGQIKATFRKAPVTFFLIVINLGFLVATVVMGGFEVDVLVELGALAPFLVRSSEYYRILTSMFLHGGALHFLMNMIGLYYLGTAMESCMGPIRYSALYFLSGIGGGMAIMLFGSPYDVVVGASGALYGIMAGMLFITIKHKYWFIPSAVRSIRVMVLLNFGITFLFPSISVAGHLGGFVIGFIVSLFLVPKSPYFLRFRRSVVRPVETPNVNGHNPIG